MGRQGDKAAKKSRERVCPPRTEEGSVLTIVLNDEESHDQPACGKRKSQREQHRNLDRGIHRGYQSEVAYARSSRAARQRAVAEALGTARARRAGVAPGSGSDDAVDW
jgi:hypothetical protein